MMVNKTALIFLLYALFAGAASAQDNFAYPPQLQRYSQVVAAENCPAEFTQARAVFAEIPQEIKKNSVLWSETDAAYDRWYFNIPFHVFMAANPMPKSVKKYVVWVPVTAEIVVYPINILTLAKEVAELEIGADMADVLESIEQNAEALSASLALGECLYPTAKDLQEINSPPNEMGEAAIKVTNKLECKKWFEFSHMLLDAVQTVEPRALSAKSQSLLEQTVGQCKEEG